MLGDEIVEGLGRCSSGDAVALVGAPEVVKGHECIEVDLQLVGRRVPPGPALNAEVLRASTKRVPIEQPAGA